MTFEDLQQLLHGEAIPEELRDKPVTGLAYDSRHVKPGDVFYALRGHLTDGHRFGEQAVKNGAALIVGEEKIPGLPVMVVENSRKALGKSADAFYDHPSQKMEIIGITATNGKTSTSYMTEKIFNEAGISTGLIGTVQTRYGSVSIPSILTTPESLDLQKFFFEMEKADVESVIMEVSSSAQEMYRNASTSYNIVTFNNLDREHIDEHGSYEQYKAMKSRLVKGASKDTVVLLSADYPEILALKDQTKGQVLLFSLKDREGDFFVEDVDLSRGFPRFRLVVAHPLETPYGKISPQVIPLEMGTPGAAAMMNGVVAAIIALVKGISPEAIKKGLEEFSGVERRFELIYSGDFQVLDDHYANRKNISATMETLKAMKYRRLHILYAIRGGRGVHLNREVAEETVKWLEELNPETFIATESQGDVMKKDQVTSGEKESFLSVMNDSGRDVPVVATIREGLETILPRCRPGDLVLLAGCQGMDHGGRHLLDLLDKRAPGVDGLHQKIQQRIC